MGKEGGSVVVVVVERLIVSWYQCLRVLAACKSLNTVLNLMDLQ
jgi:hypothetical protein